jgi:hypothetical protein
MSIQQRLFALMEHEVPDTIAGVMMVLVASVLAIWAIALLVDGKALIDEFRREGYHLPFAWFDLRRYTNFPLALGMFMLVDGMVYGVLGILILQSPSGIRLWSFLLLMAVSLTALLAFSHWAVARIPGGK